MGSTNALRILENKVFDVLTTNPAWGPLLRKTREDLERGRYQWADAFFQNYRAGMTIADVYGFALCWHHLMSGHIGHATIYVGSTPNSDLLSEENQAALNDLPAPFRALVDPGRGAAAENDGMLSWDAPITLTRTFGDDGEQRFETWLREPSCLPLEIGTTAVSTTLLHLRGGAGVARWAYESKEIIVLAAHPTLFVSMETLMKRGTRE